MAKLLIKSDKLNTSSLEQDILDLVLDGTIERFYDASTAGTVRRNGTVITAWADRGNSKQTASQNQVNRYPRYRRIQGTSAIDFLFSDKCLNFPFPGAFNGRLFISSLDGFLNLPVNIAANPNYGSRFPVGSIRMAGSAAWIRDTWFNGSQDPPVLGIFFVNQVKWDSLSEIERNKLEKDLLDWHISKGGKSDNFASANFAGRFFGGNSFYDWVTEFPFIDTSKAIDLSYLFTGCAALTYLPLLNTSRCKNLYYAFAQTGLQAVPPIDTSRVNSLTLFLRLCTQIRSVPPLNTSQVIDFLYTCSRTSNLRRFPLIDTTAARNFFSAWADSALTPQSVDNILISIAAGFAFSNKNLRGSNQNVGGLAIVGGTNAAPTNILRTWDYLEDQTESLTPDSDAAQWTSVNVNTDTFIFTNPHRLAMGREVKVKATTGGGITNDTKYFVIWVSLTELKLATTLENALKGVAIDITDFVSTSGRLKEVYEFNLDVPPWTALKAINRSFTKTDGTQVTYNFTQEISGQQAKNYILNVHGVNIATN